MVETTMPAPGTIAHLDLTVPDAEGLRDFYADLLGWQPQPLDMGGYSDFVMLAPDGATPVAGVCHARGDNADLPPQWLVYIAVDDLDGRIAACQGRGGTVVSGPKGEGPGRYCVIRDPAGAVLALMARS